MELYHCTSYEAADAILEGGYRAPIKDHWIGSFASLFFRMLPEKDRRRILKGFEHALLRDYAERSAFTSAMIEARAERKIERAWLKHFGDGVIVWVTRGAPWSDEYGEAALAFTPPDGSVDMSPGDERTMFWCPGRVVPASRFRRHPLAPSEK